MIQEILPRELTYPLPRYLWRLLSFSQGRICYFTRGYSFVEKKIQESRNPKGPQPPFGCIPNKNLVTNGINCQPQLVFSPDFWLDDNFPCWIMAEDFWSPLCLPTRILSGPGGLVGAVGKVPNLKDGELPSLKLTWHGLWKWGPPGSLEIPIGKHHFQGRTVSFREGISESTCSVVYCS